MQEYEELKDNVLGLSLEKYNSLPTNANGIKKAIGVPNGTQLEVFNETTGTIDIYAEAIKELWFER